MKSHFISKLTVGLLMLGIVGVTNSAIATPISYSVSGRAALLSSGPGFAAARFSFTDFTGYMVIDDAPVNVTPGAAVRFDIIDFTIDFGVSSIGAMSGNSGYLKHGAFNTDFGLYGTGDIDFMSATDMKASTLSLSLLEEYQFLESFQITPRVASILSVTLNQTPVPEPASILLFGMGVAGLAGRKFLRKKKS